MIPCLLWAASGGAEPTPGTALADLWRGIDADESPFPMWDLDAKDDDVNEEPEDAWPDIPLKPRPVQVTPFLKTQIEQQPVDPERRARFLSVAWDIAERRVKPDFDRSSYILAGGS